MGKLSNEQYLEFKAALRELRPVKQVYNNTFIHWLIKLFRK